MSEKCDCLLAGRTEVPYSGSKKSGILFVGESPGRQEEKQGEPFIGPAGSMLRKHAREAGIDMLTVRIANSARCLIDKKSLSNKEQREILASCRHFLVRQIDHMQPKIIVLLGDYALRQVLKTSGITKKRGKLLWSKEFNTYCLPMFHPAYLMRAQHLEPFLAQDMHYLKRLQDKDFNPSDLPRSKTNYKIVESIMPLLRAANASDKPIRVALDTETQGMDFTDPNTFVISYSISWAKGKGRQIMLHQLQKKGGTIPVECSDGKTRYAGPIRGRFSVQNKLGELYSLLDNKNIRIYMQNGNYDKHHIFKLFRMYDMAPPEFKYYVMDIQAGAHCLDENLFKMASLDDMQRYFLETTSEWKSEFYGKYDAAHMVEVPKEDLCNYAVEDADLTRQIGLKIVKGLKEHPRLENYFKRLVMPVISQVLFTLEENGVHFDLSAMKTVRNTLQENVQKYYDGAMAVVPKRVIRVHREKGLKFTRRDFLSDILFSNEGFRLDPITITKDGKFSVDRPTRVVLSEQDLPERVRTFLECYENWSEWNGLLSRSLSQLVKAIRSDGRVHSSYSLTIPVTGRVSCLAKGTKIYVLDPRGKVKIEDIKEGDWIWSYGDDLIPSPHQVKQAKRTGKNVQTIKVVFQTQGRRKKKSIRCTPEHLFRLRDGSYIRADRLTKGHRVLSLERGTDHGYRRLWFTGLEGEMREHRLVYSRYHEEKIKPHTHHKDENRKNNVPSNLESLTPKDHFANHPWSDEQKEKVGSTIKRMYSEGKIVQPIRLGADNPNWVELDREWCLKVLWENQGKPTVFRDTYHMDYEGTMKKLKLLGIDWKEIRNQFNNKGEQITPELIAKAKACNHVWDAVHVLGVSFYRARKILRDDNNHMVLRVEKDYKRVDVYDLTIDGDPNFIANGVCVHNSSSPNLMNMPKRSRSSKEIGRLISVPDDSWTLVEADLSQCELRVIAHVAQEEEMIRVYRNGEDIHLNTAKAFATRPWKRMSDEERKELRTAAKPANFGIIYGSSPQGFMSYSNMTFGVKMELDQARDFMDIWFETYPGIRRYHRWIENHAKRYGFVESPLGRRRRVPAINSDQYGLRNEALRQAINFPIQSSASDWALFALWWLLHKKMINTEVCRPVLFIHDSLGFQVKKDYLMESAEAIKYAMENAPLKKYFGFDLCVPMIADLQYGPNRAEMEDLLL